MVTASILDNSPPPWSEGRPRPAAPERDTAQQTGDELPLRLQRTLDLRLAPEHLAALIEIHRAVAGHLDRRALFTAIAQALQGVVPVSRSLLLLPSNDPTALTIYASHGRLGVEFYQGQTIARTGSIPGWVVEHGRPFVLDRAEHIRERFPVSYQRLRQWGMESVAVVPLLTEGRCVGALSLMSEQADAWSGVASVLLEEIEASMAAALEHCVAYEEVGRLRDESRSPGSGADGAVPARPLLPAERVSGRDAAASRASRRHPAAGHVLPLALLQEAREADQCRRAGDDAASQCLRVAGKCP